MTFPLSLVATLSLLIAGAANAAENGNPAAGKEKSETCVACHGAGGNSTNPVWPKLAGQHASYIVKQLHDFKSGARKASLMAGPVAPLNEQDMVDLATYFSQQPISAGGAAKDKVALGEQLYRSGNTETQVPACTACHGPRGQGNAAAGFPQLSGQHSAYTVAQLKAYRDGTRDNDGDSKTMRTVTGRMTDAEIEAVAEYASGLH